jgi:intracellular septation protein A|tara:strand:+ start:1419 stop:2174 length:756 start_codon:yes stop_codon:yes gene_type:complete
VIESKNTPESATIADENNGAKKPERQKASGMLANLAFNIIIPTLILTKLSSNDYLGPVYSIVVALSFPIIYGLRDYAKSRKANFFSILGIISVVLTGGMSLLQLDPQYIAIKEAAIPAIFGLVTIYSVRTSYPLVKTFLYNDQILQIGKVQSALLAYNNELNFEAKLTNASYMVAGSFFLSSALNYILAKVVLVSQPGTVEFTEELGKMTALSFPIIAVPSTLVLMGTLFYLLRHIQKLTHLKLEDIFHES